MTQFEGQRYIALETFRRNGEGVKTAVWFVEDSGKLYIWTIANSGKAKRIGNNSEVRVTPSSARGQPKGKWVGARARFLNPADSMKPRGLIGKKYGLQFWLLNQLHGRGRVVIEVDLSQSSG